MDVDGYRQLCMENYESVITGCGVLVIKVKLGRSLRFS